MWIAVHQNVLDLRRTTLVTWTTLVPTVPLYFGFLSLFSFGSLHSLYVYKNRSGHSPEKT